MKAGDLEKRLRWFDRGAAAFSQVFPDALAFLGPNASPHYVCPECAEPDASGQNYKVQLFSRTAVQRRELTAEHVPPKAFSGRELLLTCKSCNHRGGFELEAHARKRENPYDVLRGVATKPARVRLMAGRFHFSAELKVEEGMLELQLPPESRNANDPKEWPAYKQEMIRKVGDLPPITIEFSNDAHSFARANAAWLRHAYLALFAVAGYRYIFQPGLGIVRKQIKEPDADHIPTFLAALPGEHPWSQRRILMVREPEWLQSWAVQIGRYVVFLPRPGDTSFYARLAEDGKIANRRQFNCDVFDWPTEPSFGLDSVEP